MLLSFLPVFFVTASVPLSPDQQTTLYRTFVLLLKYALHIFSLLPPILLHDTSLQIKNSFFYFLFFPFFSRCPFLLNLDLIGIANRFAQFNLPAFALGTLLLIPSAQKKAQQIHVSVFMSVYHLLLSKELPCLGLSMNHTNL